MQSILPFERIKNLSIPVKILGIIGLGALAVVAWPAMIAVVFALIVLTTLQDKRFAYAMTAAMIVPALLMEGVWVNSLFTTVMNSNQNHAASEGARSNVAVADFNQQVRGAQDEGSDPKVVVTEAISGDTVEVEIDGRPDRVKLIGIDAPEIVQGGSSECFAVESHLFLNSLLKNISVEIVADQLLGDKDENGNLLRYLRMRDGTKVNELMLEAGLARENSVANYELQEIYVELANSASQNNKGLWASCKDDGSPKVEIPSTEQEAANSGDSDNDSQKDFVQPTSIPTVNPNQ